MGDEIDRTGLCTVRDCVKYMFDYGDEQCELSYVEDVMRYNVTVKASCRNVAEHVKALRVKENTLIGFFNKKFPVKDGNYFSVYADDGNFYDIINMYHENLLEMDRIGVSFPYEINVIGNGKAEICDERIPCDWYIIKGV